MIRSLPPLMLVGMMLTGCGGQDAGGTAQHNGMNTAPSQNLAVAIADAPEPANRAEPTIDSPVDQPKPLVSRETSPPPPERFDYRAIGTEPFWAVTVRGRIATLERPDAAPIRYHVEREDSRHRIRFVGEGLSLMATEGPCSDGMSDAIWSDRVSIAFSGGTLKGCGGLRDEAPDDLREEGF